MLSNQNLHFSTKPLHFLNSHLQSTFINLCCRRFAPLQNSHKVHKLPILKKFEIVWILTVVLSLRSTFPLLGMAGFWPDFISSPVANDYNVWLPYWCCLTLEALRLTEKRGERSNRITATLKHHHMYKQGAIHSGDYPVLKEHFSEIFKSVKASPRWILNNL